MVIKSSSGRPCCCTAIGASLALLARFPHRSPHRESSDLIDIGGWCGQEHDQWRVRGSPPGAFQRCAAAPAQRGNPRVRCHRTSARVPLLWLRLGRASSFEDSESSRSCVAERCSPAARGLIGIRNMLVDVLRQGATERGAGQSEGKAWRLSMNLDLVGQPVPWPPSARRGLRALPAAPGSCSLSSSKRGQAAFHAVENRQLSEARLESLKPQTCCDQVKFGLRPYPFRFARILRSEARERRAGKRKGGS